MKNPLIKICGINNKADAQTIAQLPIDFAGFIFHPDSPRSISLDEAIACTQAFRDTSISPVAVFVNQMVNEMLAICNKCNIKVVQLHGEIARNEHQYLPEFISRIFVVELSTSGEVLTNLSSISKLSPSKDFLLFDLKKGQENKNIHFSKLKEILKQIINMPFLIAGGINNKNVKYYLNKHFPDGIDVAGGVENADYTKNMELIRHLILNTNGVTYAR